LFVKKIGFVAFAIFTQGLQMPVSTAFSTWAVLPAASWIDHAIDAAFPVSSASGWMWLQMLA
jgi:hypothetical protein